MNMLRSTYGKQLKKGLVLLFVYVFHLLACQILLSQPSDVLSTNSFGDHHKRPSSEVDYLLLLAKKERVKSQITFENLYLSFDSSIAFTCVVLTQFKMAQFRDFCLSTNFFKRYCRLGVLLL
jgi:hypothetical protein